MSTYKNIEAERRDGDDQYFAKYNIFKDGEEEKEYFMRKEQNRTKKKSTSTTGKSNTKKGDKKKGDWAVRTTKKNGDDEVKAEMSEPHSAHTVKSIFENFDFVDSKKLGAKRGGRIRRKKSSKKAAPKKKKSTKKRTSTKRKSRKA